MVPCFGPTYSPQSLQLDWIFIPRRVLVATPPRSRGPMHTVVLPGPTYLPLEKVSEGRRVVESAHPYQSGEDCSWPIAIEGAETVEVG